MAEKRTCSYQRLGPESDIAAQGNLAYVSCLGPHAEIRKQAVDERQPRNIRLSIFKAEVPLNGRITHAAT